MTFLELWSVMMFDGDLYLHFRTVTTKNTGVLTGGKVQNSNNIVYCRAASCMGTWLIFIG
jgi:hypothetical protein